MSVHDSIMAAMGGSDATPVEVPEWGCSVYFKRFSVSEWLPLISDESDDRTWKLLAAALTDENGEAILTVDEITAMPASHTNVLLRLMKEVQRINGASESLGET